MRSQEVPTNEVEKARVDEYLAELPDEEYEALTRRVRPRAHIRHPAPRNIKRRNTGG
jgi:hypothetical protein